MLTGSPKKKKRSHKTLNITLAIIGVMFLSSIVYSPFLPKNITVKPGEVSTETITSPRFIEIETNEDQKRTERLRQERASLVEKVYSINNETNKINQSRIVSFFTELRDFQKKSIH